MLLFTDRAEPESSPPPSLELSLSHDQRRRARLRLQLPDGTLVGLMLERGLSLKDGDCLRSQDGEVVARVRAAPEHLSRVSTDDPWLLARAAYHLGNRHVALEVSPGQLSYLHDHVLDAMCLELGLTLQQVIAPFQPEGGGYGHAHGHGHTHVLLPRAHSHG